MNIVRAMIKPTMILTILLALSCAIQPISNKGGDFSPREGILQSTTVVVRQDTPKVASPRPLTPAQIEMTRRINKAFNSIDEISGATGDISKATKEIVATNKMLVSVTVLQQKQIDSLTDQVSGLDSRNDRIRLALENSQKEAERVRKNNEYEAKMAAGFRTLMLQYTSYIFIAFCVLGGLVLLQALVLWLRERRFKSLVKHGT